MPSNQLIVLPSAPDISESYSAADEEISRAISRAQENLLRQQKPDGHWCGELLVDAVLVFYVYLLVQLRRAEEERAMRDSWSKAA